MVEGIELKRLRKLAKQKTNELRRQAAELRRGKSNRAQKGLADPLQVGVELLRIQRALKAIEKAFPPPGRRIVKGLRSRSDFSSCSGEGLHLVRG